MARLQLLIPFVMVILWFFIWRWLERLLRNSRWRSIQRLAMAQAISGQATAWIILSIVFVALAKTREVVASAAIAFLCALLVSIPSAAVLAGRLFPASLRLTPWSRLSRGIVLAEVTLLLTTTIGILASAGMYASLVEISTRDLLDYFSEPFFMLSVFGSIPAVMSGCIFAIASAYLQDKN